MVSLAFGLLFMLAGLSMVRYRQALSRIRSRLYARDIFPFHGTEIAALLLGWLLTFAGIVLALLGIDQLFGG